MTLADLVLEGAWFTEGELNFDNLPDSVEVEPELAGRMVTCTLQKAPDIPGGFGEVYEKRHEEYGGNIAWLSDLNKLQLGDVKRGTEEEVRNIWPGGSIIDAARNRFAVGTFHTHPYAGSNAGAGFSAADIASMLANKDEIVCLVQSFTTLYLLARTKQTNPNRSELVTSEFDKYRRRAIADVKETTPHWQINPTLNVFTEGMTKTIAASAIICLLASTWVVMRRLPVQYRFAGSILSTRSFFPRPPFTTPRRFYPGALSILLGELSTPITVKIAIRSPL